MKQQNFNNLRDNLTDDDICQLLALLTVKCRIKTYKRMESLLRYGARSVPQYGIFDRLIKENGRWQYVAGQSYVDEIRTIRELILKG